MLVTPESGEDGEADYDPNLTIAEPPQAGYDPTLGADATRVTTTKLPSLVPKKNSGARSKLESLPPPPVVPPKASSPKPKFTAKPKPSPTLPKKQAVESVSEPSKAKSPLSPSPESLSSDKQKELAKVSDKIAYPIAKAGAAKFVESTPSSPTTLPEEEALDLDGADGVEESTEIGRDLSEDISLDVEFDEDPDSESELESLADEELELLADEELESLADEELEELEEPAIDELETVILAPPSKEVLAAQPTGLSPFDSDILQESSELSTSPFDDSVSMDEPVLTKTVADVSVDLELSANKSSTPRESESTPDVFTRTVAEAMPVVSPTPPPDTSTPLPVAPSTSGPVAVSGAIVAGNSLAGTPSSVLPGVGPAPQSLGQSPSQLLPKAPVAVPENALPTATPAPPSSANSPAAFVAPKSWNAAPVESNPDTMADIPSAYAVQSAVPESAPPSAMIPTAGSAVPRAAIPTPHSGAIAAGQIGGSGMIPQMTPAPPMAGAMGPQMTPAPPQTIGPPPQMSAGNSYPGNALAALEEAGPNPANPNQVWKQAHPSAQRWAQKRQVEAPRTPKPMMIALGLLLCGVGFYLLSIFLPSKAPLSAAEKLALASQAGVDENAWRFTEQLLLAANLNAGLFVFLGLVVVLRGAFFRALPTAASKKKSGKTSILLIFCFVLLALSFAALFITGST